METTTTVSCPYCNSDALVILDGMDGELDLVSDCETAADYSGHNHLPLPLRPKQTCDLFGIDLKALHKLEASGRVMMKLIFLM